MTTEENCFIIFPLYDSSFFDLKIVLHVLIYLSFLTFVTTKRCAIHVKASWDVTGERSVMQALKKGQG